MTEKMTKTRYVGLVASTKFGGCEAVHIMKLLLLLLEE